MFSEEAYKITDILKLRSYPIALKLLKDQKDIPSFSIRPREDWGFHLSLCQAFGIVRRGGFLRLSQNKLSEKEKKLTIAMLKEDMWCFEPVIGLGIAEPPKYFLEGYNRYPDDVATLNAGAYWAQNEFPRFRVGYSIGVLIAPLHLASFQPDVIIIYADPIQVTLLTFASSYRTGEDIISKLSGHAACVYAVVPAAKENKPKVTLPCQGDRRHGTTQDYELIFSIPYSRFTEIIEGLKFLAEKEMRKIPFRVDIRPEYELRDTYRKIGKMIGMDIP